MGFCYIHKNVSFKSIFFRQISILKVFVNVQWVISTKRAYKSVHFRFVMKHVLIRDKLIVAGRGFFSRVAGFVAGRGFLTKIAGFFAGIFFAGFFSRVLISYYSVLARGGARCITSAHRRMYSFQNIRFIF